MLSGVDISNWQGTVDWQAVATAGYAFAICKASEGTTFRDPTFPSHWAAVRATGMVRAAYHFAQPDHSRPAEEAASFLAALEAAGGLVPTDIVALDLEAGSGDLRPWAETWVTAVHDSLGFWPLFYSSPAFTAEHNLAGSPVLGQCGLWLADWGTTLPPPPPGWQFIAFWQDTDHGTVPGIAGDVDLDLFNGTIEQLRAYGKPEPEPRRPFDAAARLELVAYIAGGSSPADVAAWCGQFS